MSLPSQLVAKHTLTMEDSSLLIFPFYLHFFILISSLGGKVCSKEEGKNNIMNNIIMVQAKILINILTQAVFRFLQHSYPQLWRPREDRREADQGPGGEGGGGGGC